MPTDTDWEGRWRQRDTPWEKGRAVPALAEALERFSIDRGEALVPGCGMGHDVRLLAGAGFHTVGLDISETARTLFEEVNPDRTSAEYLVADFFEHSFPAPFRLVFDYTFLCAIPKSLRESWATRMKELVVPGGELWALVYPIGPDSDEGPPFPLDPTRVRALLGDAFELLDEFVPRESHPGREGRERMLRLKRV